MVLMDGLLNLVRQNSYDPDVIPAVKTLRNIVISTQGETRNPTTRIGFPDFFVSFLREMTICLRLIFNEYIF